MNLIDLAFVGGISCVTVAFCLLLIGYLKYDT
jgi:hypothetical protein